MARFGRKTTFDSAVAEPAPADVPQAERAAAADPVVTVSRATTSEAKDYIRDHIFTRIEPLVAVRISKQELMAFVTKRSKNSFKPR